VRIGEALGLQWKDLDLEKEIALIRRNIPIHRQVQRTKTKSSERSVDLSRASHSSVEDDGSVQWIFGNFSEYHENLKKRRGASDQPHRLKYRTLRR
jgi:integrase